MSTKALGDYTFYSRYARHKPEESRRETWNETCNRVFDDMHYEKYANEVIQHPELKDYIEEAREGLKKKRILGSQRALQFGGAPILKHEMKIFNCAFGHICYDRVFNETMFLLLGGCGVGFSVQKHHIHMLKELAPRTNGEAKFQLPDSIEGWADAIGILMSSFTRDGLEGFEEYAGKVVEFDFSLIRPEGALIAGGFKAPGSLGLQGSMKLITNVLEKRLAMESFGADEFKHKMRPIDAYDVIMHMSDAVLSGGVRRSATIAMFSIDDDDMMSAKTGNWFIENPQRGRSNNSVVLVRDEVTKEQFMRIKDCVVDCGEPGFVFVEDRECGANPCVEIGFRPVTEDGRHGFQFCNLSSINGKFSKTPEQFYQACREASIIGTLQAGFTNFSYLGPVTRELTEREALLGVSITGIMDTPEITLDKSIQRKGAKIIKKVNEEVAAILGINPAARLTCIKPEGSASCLLGTSSGIHPHHAKRYMRRVQANKLEYPLQYFTMFNPRAVEESVWSNNGTDMSITFLCEVPAGAITKNQLNAIELLDNVKLTQQNWVEYGTVEERGMKPGIRHNVSNTITVMDDEWDEVFDYLFKNKAYFSGVSLLPLSGDKDYPQAPFCTVHNEKELSKMYGPASMFASGLVTAGLRAYGDDLWKACTYATGLEELQDETEKYQKALKDITATEERYVKGYAPLWDDPEFQKMQLAVAVADDELDNYEESYHLKQDWIRRALQFADRYFDGNVRQMTYCLKDVYNLKLWCDLKREYVDVDWSKAYEENATFEDIDTLGAIACAGGKCTVDF